MLLYAVCVETWEMLVNISMMHDDVFLLNQQAALVYHPGSRRPARPQFVP